MLVKNRAYGYRPSPDEPHALITAPYQDTWRPRRAAARSSTAGDLHRLLACDVPRQRDQSRDDAHRFRATTCSRTRAAARDSTSSCGATSSTTWTSSCCATTTRQAWSPTSRDLALIARGEVNTPAWRGDVAADSAAVRPFVGKWRAGTPLPYGDSFAIAWRASGPVFEIEGKPVDYLLPQEMTGICR
jgi:hypothetical protein